MPTVVVRIKLDKIKSNVISLDIRVLRRKIVSLRFLAAVLLLCSSFSSWDWGAMCYPDSWKATMYMRESFRPKPILTRRVQSLSQGLAPTIIHFFVWNTSRVYVHGTVIITMYLLRAIHRCRAVWNTHQTRLSPKEMEMEFRCSRFMR